VFFVVHPQSVSTCLGSTAAFKSDAVGTPPISYQWLFNGTPIPGATSASLSLTNLGLEHNGAYSLVGSNAAGAVESRTAFLSVGVLSGGAGTHNGNWSKAAADVPPWLTNVVSISSRGFQNIALKDDGTVVCWGPRYDEFGDYLRTFEDAVFYSAPLGLSNVVAVSAGYSEFFALKEDGTVVSWGKTSFVPPGLSNIVAIDYTWALSADGALYMWDRWKNENSPVTVLTNVATMAWGDTMSELFAMRDGTVRWGGGTFEGLTNVVALASGQYWAPFRFGAALLADGRVAHFAYSQMRFSRNTNYFVAVAAGGGEHKPVGAITRNRDAMFNIEAGYVSQKDVLDMALGMDHTVYLLRNPKAPQSLRLQPKLSADGKQIVLRTSGIIGKIPIILESSTNCSDWTPVRTNWPHSTIWDVQLSSQSGEPARFFRVRRY
jgi:hypothetical protein